MEFEIVGIVSNSNVKMLNAVAVDFRTPLKVGNLVIQSTLNNYDVRVVTRPELKKEYIPKGDGYNRKSERPGKVIDVVNKNNRAVISHTWRRRTKGKILNGHFLVSYGRWFREVISPKKFTELFEYV